MRNLYLSICLIEAADRWTEGSNALHICPPETGESGHTHNANRLQQATNFISPINLSRHEKTLIITLEFLFCLLTNFVSEVAFLSKYGFI